MGMIKPEALGKVCWKWVRPYIGGCRGKHIDLDGKTIRGASGMVDINIHMVSAWVTEARIAMGRIRAEEKNNEITAIPVLLAAPDVRGAIVSIDAMGCKKAIAQQIIAQEAQTCWR